ncbi:MAG TPA: hypothetical protein VK790_09680 [Solirubrobacteraceae bacterium]|jgi:hypothetical protein|nr:hypothetical protein [Solirubrobacteraceae bacterium]
MHHTHSNSSRPATAALILVLASLALAACGGGSSTTTTNASATTSKTGLPGIAGKAHVPGTGRFLALRECLKKNGITLPQRKPGQATPGAGGLLGGPVLPKGVTRAKYQEVVSKCGGGFERGRFGGSARNRLDRPQARKALQKFAACMRANGIDVGEPNTSGRGPIFSAKADTKTTQFAGAEHKCQSDLRGAFGGRPGAQAGAAPPSGSGG